MKKTRKSKEKFKEELIKLIVQWDSFENKQLNEKAEKVTRYEYNIPIVREYERIIKTQYKNIILLCIA